MAQRAASGLPDQGSALRWTDSGGVSGTALRHHGLPLARLARTLLG
jgi:hypothetical protein